MQIAKQLATLFLVTSLVPLTSTGTEQEALKCDIGPVKKIYGKTQWLVYSCSDNKTIVVVSDTGNPAMPFYFTFYPKQGGYHLTGEGTGKKEATAAAFNDLEKMTESNIKTLISETVQINEQKKNDRNKSP